MNTSEVIASATCKIFVQQLFPNVQYTYGLRMSCVVMCTHGGKYVHKHCGGGFCTELETMMLQSQCVCAVVFVWVSSQLSHFTTVCCAPATGKYVCMYVCMYVCIYKQRPVYTCMQACNTEIPPHLIAMYGLLPPTLCPSFPTERELTRKWHFLPPSLPFLCPSFPASQE